MLQIYDKLLTIDKRYLTGKEIARTLDIKPRNLAVTLTRLAKKKILRRLRRNLYEVTIRPSDILEAANTIYQPSYLSFLYCLGALGILNQIAYEIEFATSKKTKHLEIRDRAVVYRKIKRELFFGYSLKDNVFMAKPEKALLDTLYLESKGIATLNREELNLAGLSKAAFLKMSGKFPPNVRREALELAKKMKNSPHNS